MRVGIESLYAAVAVLVKRPFKGQELVEFGAGNETRTRDPDLGKVVLYQLSYSRVRLILRAAEFYVHPFGSQGESPGGLCPSILIRNTGINIKFNQYLI